MVPNLTELTTQFRRLTLTKGSQNNISKMVTMTATGSRDVQYPTGS